VLWQQRGSNSRKISTVDDDRPEWMDDEVLRKAVADFEAMKKLFEPDEALLKAFAEASQLANAFSDSLFERAVKEAASLAAMQNRFVEDMKLEHEFLPRLAAHGWLISPLSPWDEPRRLRDLFEQGGIDAVESDLLASFDADDYRLIVADITKRRPSFGEWSATFEKAVAAMERGDDQLAIPIWLAALDGLCRAELAIHDVYSQMPKKPHRKAIETKLVGGVVHNRQQPLVVAWLEVLLGLSVHNADPNVALLNRHAVMHGRRPHIGTRKDAIQCLLALQVLGYLLDLRDSLTEKPQT
jgi:hypothetical protein